VIRIIKGPIPEVLQRNGPRWSAEVDQARQLGQVPRFANRYRDPQIKLAVIAETHGKCAYCETRIRHVAPGDVEHILPKSRRPELWFDWENLTFACPVCNQSKGEFYDANVSLINPLSEDPSEHFLAVGASLWRQPNDDRAQLTIDQIGLDRPDLRLARSDRLKSVYSLVEQWRRLPEGSAKEAALAQLMREADDNKEYAFVVRVFLRSQGVPGISL
jgi:uncharacterized protein (TIGR02646 family)